MVRTTRVALAAVLAVAVAVLPLVLDRCRVTCEARHDTVAGPPACHHAGTATAVVAGHAPAKCGHDHNGTLVTAAGGLTATPRPFVATAAVVAIPVNPAFALKQHLRTHAPPGTASTLLDRGSIPLRM